MARVVLDGHTQLFGLREGEREPASRVKLPLREQRPVGTMHPGRAAQRRVIGLEKSHELYSSPRQDLVLHQKPVRSRGSGKEKQQEAGSNQTDWCGGHCCSPGPAPLVPSSGTGARGAGRPRSCGRTRARKLTVKPTTTPSITAIGK